MSLYEEKHELYWNYFQEILAYSNQEAAKSDSDRICDEYINSRCVTWKNIFDLKSGTLVGFLVIGKEWPYVHPQTDRCIEQAYVLPEYRKRGLMSSQVRDYESRHRCRYGLLVVERNTYAKRFWENLFADMGYKTIPLDERFVNNDPREKTLLYGFVPDNERDEI